MAKHLTIYEKIAITDCVSKGKTADSISKETNIDINRIINYCRKNKIKVKRYDSDLPKGKLTKIPNLEGYFIDIKNREVFSNKDSSKEIKKIKPILVSGREYYNFTVSKGKRISYSMSKLLYCTDKGIGPDMIKEQNMTINENGDVIELSETHNSKKKRKNIMMYSCSDTKSQVDYLNKQVRISMAVIDCIKNNNGAKLIEILESLRPQAESYLDRVGLKKKDWQEISIDKAIDSIAESLFKEHRCYLISEYTIGAFARKNYMQIRKNRSKFVALDQNLE